MIKMMMCSPPSSKEVDDSDDKLLFAEILSSFPNFDQVAINQVPEILSSFLVILLLNSQLLMSLDSGP